MAATTYQAYYQYELKKLMEEEVARLTSVITAEHEVIHDYPTYRYFIGTIQGIRKAIQLCDEAEAVVNGKE
jgi:hypothetical protein